ncbi:MAG TPA: FkbM family methyltransferase [Candidatus Dojkabacteria bacterium]|nr:FkbM family methyltransferase [Candidatus Dojkabacteria bacterium]
MNQFFFGEQIEFNTGLFVAYWAKERKMKRFFKNDDSFWCKLNVDIEYLYENCKRGGIKFVSHDEGNQKLYFKFKKINLVTDYSVGILIQIFGLQAYKLEKQLFKPKSRYIVIDIGMNKAFSSIWFAMRRQTDIVVGYEMNPILKSYIDENLELNPSLSSKIIVNLFGLSDKEGEVAFYSLKNDDGVGTMNEKFYIEYWSKERKSKMKKIMAKTKIASKEISKVFKKFPNHEYILKIDVEGAEYEIFENLSKNNLLKKFDLILGETHNGMDGIKKYLEEFDLVEENLLPGNLATFIAKKRH